MQLSKQIARNYAQALIELTKSDLSLQEVLLNEIKFISELINSTKDAKEVFNNPGISKEEKQELIKKLFGEKVNEKSLNLLFLLIDKQRFNLLSEIQNQLSNLVNKNKGIVIAKVSSTSKLDTNTLESLKQRLEKILGKSEKVTIESRIEPELIGGFVVRVNDLVYDGSIKGRLENLKRRLVT